jgi:hypothetical protein
VQEINMRNGIKTIDSMSYVATPEFIAKWTEAKKGELICRMGKAIGGCGTMPPSFSGFKPPRSHRVQRTGA